MATISFRNVNKIYPNQVQAVFDFNLEIQDKEFIVFVGPSGCGKSTTLRMVAGFEDISSGEIAIDGRVVNLVAPKDRDIAMVFQNYALYPHMTVFDNMAFALRMRKVETPLVDVDTTSPEYQEKKAKIIADSKKAIEEKVASMKEAKEVKEKIAEAKFELESQRYSDLLHLDQEYTKPVLSYDHKKVTALEKEIASLKTETSPDEAKIASLEQEKASLLAKEDVPVMTTRHYTNKEITDKVLEAAKILGLVPYLKRKPSALSGGQRQRVALGRAIVRKPKVFLMDEPLSNLDAKLRVQTRSEIIKIHQRVGATTIYVTHDQTEAMTMASRIVVMKDGYVQQIGTPDEVYNRPANMFVAGFIGSPSMNFLNGVYDGESFVLDGESKKKIHLTESSKKRLAGYENKRVVFGIRPENISVKEDVALENPSAPFELPAEIVELLGYERIVYGSVDSQRITIKVPAKFDIRVGETNEYVYDTTKAHFFDPETTKVIGE